MAPAPTWLGLLSFELLSERWGASDFGVGEIHVLAFLLIKAALACAKQNICNVLAFLRRGKEAVLRVKIPFMFPYYYFGF